MKTFLKSLAAAAVGGAAASIAQVAATGNHDPKALGVAAAVGAVVAVSHYLLESPVTKPAQP
jgi:hypothetical protein